MTSRFVNSIANTSGLLPEIRSKTQKWVSGERNSFTLDPLNLKCFVGQGSRQVLEVLRNTYFNIWN